MRRGWLLLMCVASCGPNSGEARIHVELPATMPAIASVSLYAGIGGPQQDGIGAKGFQQHIPVQVWNHDDTSEFTIDAANLQSVDFVLRPGGQPVGIVIAVGEDTTGTPVAAGYIDSGITVTPSEVDNYTLALETVVPIKDTSPMPLRAEVWSPPATTPQPKGSCVWIVDKRTSTSDMIVTANDPDCDGLVQDQDQCDQKVYLAHRSARIEEATCTFSEHITVSGGMLTDCVIGGPMCDDLTGPIPGCNDGIYCVPASACVACLNTPAGSTFDCLEDVSIGGTSTSFTFSHISCPLAFQAGQLCGTAQTVVLPPEVAGRNCQRDPVLYDPSTMMWQDQAKLPNGIQVQMQNITNCNFDLVLTGQPGSTAPSATIVAGELDNGRGFAIPITFTGDGAATCPPQPCTYIPNSGAMDVFPECIMSPPPM